MESKNSFNQERWWIILNPKAGNGRAARQRKAIEQLLRTHGFSFHLVETQYVGHATPLVVEGIEAGYRHFMGVGGDGTNNELINGILQQQLIAPTDLYYTLLPLGTGNDWIKQHRIPGNWKKWIPQLAAAKVFLHDAGLLHFMQNGKPQQRYFVNVAGLAYDAFIAQKKGEATPNFLPTLYYLWQVVVCLFQYRLRKATIRFDNHTITDFFYTINIGICKYSGGGMQLVPHADPQSGKLALTVAGTVSKITLLLHVPHIYLGQLHRHPKVKIYTTKEIQITAAESASTWLEADGEFLGETPVNCTVLNGAFKVLVPGS
jgi:diacylglycerol kinase (ATP)